ncbi:MAG: hypothetical protein M1830_005675 [Pleopsidium flavum]|nr:MAG: hypothetical protein M1830_005675 [Pleopsidium flavum]
MSSAKVFSLEGKGLKLDIAADAEPHIKALRDNSAIEEVRLGGNTLGVEACEALAQVLKTKKSLQIANLADIFTSRLLFEIPPSLSSLLTAFLALPSLHTIDLSDNAFGLNTQAPLVAFLSSHVPLTHLILNNNGLGPRAGVLVGDALTKLAGKKEEARRKGDSVPDLETVICGRNRLENGSMSAWAKVYAAHRGVKIVKMVQNGIRQDGISYLLREGLRHAKDLKVLDLQDNTFTIMGSKTLSEVVAGWPGLRELGVGDCLLSARGGMVVAEALGKGTNKALEVLRLQYNDIDAKALTAFKNAAKDALPALKRIELNGNKFDEEDPSIEALRELLDERKNKAGSEDDDVEDLWGLDSLSDLEEDSDEEDEEDEDEDKADGASEDEEEKEEKAEKLLQDADKAEDENVPLDDDKNVDDLAEKLGKTGL